MAAPASLLAGPVGELAAPGQRVWLDNVRRALLTSGELAPAGQANKGGSNRGVFLQLSCTDRVELNVPGHGYTFGVVKEAQARADLDVLARRGRRALRVDLGPDPTGELASLRHAVERALS